MAGPKRRAEAPAVEEEPRTLSHQQVVNRYRSARSDPELAVLEGFHALKHALRFGAEVLEIRTSDPENLQRLSAELAPELGDALAERAVETPADLFGELSPRPPGTGVIALARRREADPDETVRSAGPGPVVLLERPSHLGNLGAAVRAAAAAGAAGVLASGEHDPWHASALRGGAGLHYALPVGSVEDPVHLDMADRPLLAVDPRGEPLSAGGVPDRSVLAFGTERHGVSGALLDRADRRVRIPMREGVSSLNLAVSVAVVLYAWRLGREA